MPSAQAPPRVSSGFARCAVQRQRIRGDHGARQRAVTPPASENWVAEAGNENGRRYHGGSRSQSPALLCGSTGLQGLLTVEYAASSPDGTFKPAAWRDTMGVGLRVMNDGHAQATTRMASQTRTPACSGRTDRQAIDAGRDHPGCDKAERRGAVGAAYGALRALVSQQPVVHTDDTGWRVAGKTGVFNAGVRQSVAFGLSDADHSIAQ